MLTMTSDELLSTAQVAVLLGKSVPTINRWVRIGRLKTAGKLPGVSGAHVFARSEVEQQRHEEQSRRHSAEVPA